MSSESADTSFETGAPADRRPSRRRRAVLLSIAGVLLSTLVAGVAAFAGAGSEGSGELATTEGLIVVADDEGIVLRPTEPVDGEDEVRFVLPPADRIDELDLEHLRYHATTAWPVRIAYEREGDAYIARAASDLPGSW